MHIHEQDAFEAWAEQQQHLDADELNEAYQRALAEEGPPEYGSADSRSIGDTDIRSLDGDEEGLPSGEQLAPEATRSVSQGPGYSSEQVSSDGDQGVLRSMEGEAGHDPFCDRCARVRRELRGYEGQVSETATQQVTCPCIW